MRVHVVSRDKDWILGRLADVLVKRLGWTNSPRSRKDADVNYYVPYLLYEGKIGTKVVAFFTHLEEKAPGKAARWHEVAKVVDLRVAMCEKYRKALAEAGPAIAPPIPVDLGKFVPRRLRVGVAGQVYDTARKGEHLVSRLMTEPEFEVVAAGRGWPCPTTFYPWVRMQEFYRSLDVFLVTSEIEGGPVTLLEALACGVPVVAPRGVGFVDEFDVVKYPCGDYDSMVEKLRGMLVGRVRRRTSVRERTGARFAEVHARAFERLLS